MSKKKVNTEAEKPCYVKELLEKGVTVLSGRSCSELDEMISNIPSDCNFEVGLVSFYLDKGLYRVQVNLKQ